MKALHEFIIELPKPLNDTFVTENGVELYAHKDFSVDRLSNRIAKVVSVPAFLECDIEVGYQVMFEKTILHKQIFQGVKQGYTNYVDKDNKLFRITPNMIVLYRKDENSEWKGFGKNVMVKPIKEDKLPIVSEHILIPENTKEAYKKDRVKLIYANKDIEEMGAKNGDEVIIDPQGGIPFWFEGVEYWWLMNSHIYAVATNQDKLDTVINYSKATPKSYDGEKVSPYVLDEVGRFPNPNLNTDSWWNQHKTIIKTETKTFDVE